MRKLAVIFVFTFILGKSVAQNYVPMPMQNCFWTVDHHAQCWWLVPGPGDSYETYTVYPTTDTLINSTRYIKFYLTDHDTSFGFGCMGFFQRNAGYWGGVRQDTANQKVYHKPPGNGNEIMLYNFNVNIGDTLKGAYNSYPTAPRIVQNIYYQNFSDGVCRRVYTFKYPCSYQVGGPPPYNFNLYDKLIEGYGMNTGFDNPYSGINIGINLQEFYSNAMYINSQQIMWASTTNTCVQYIGLKENSISNEITIFPNPITDVITIEANNDSDLSFTLHNILGNVILNSNKNSIEVSHLTKGVYFLKCSNSKTGEVITKKVIKH